MNSRYLRVRDYKHPGRGGLTVDSRLRDVGRAVIVGVALAAVLLLAVVGLLRARHPQLPVPAQAAIPSEAGQHRSTARGRAITGSAAISAAADPSGTSVASGNTAGGAADAASSAGRYDFYQMLPRFQVGVPEREHGNRSAPTAQLDRAGTYFLQVGSYRDVAVAERIREQIAKLGIDATVQRIALDSDVWHRVRIGPIADLAVLNRLRRQLHSADLDSLVIRVED